MRTGAIISGALHGVAVLLVFFGLPLALQPDLPMEQPVLVELVTIADKTTPQERPKETGAEKAPEPSPPPKVKRFAAAPPPPGARPVPKPEAPRKAKLVAPPPPKPEIKLKPKPKPKPPETKVAVAPQPKPEPKAEPEKKPEAEKPAEPQRSDFNAMPRPSAKPTPPNRRFDASRLAALLDKSERKTAVAEPPEKKETKADPKKPAPQPAATRSTAPLTMTEIDAIRYQIQQCWSIPAGARDAENLVVQVRVYLNPDGTLARPPEIVDIGRNDSFFRTAAESARRAVLKCSPLKNLPAEKYRHWRELTLTFNPRDMLDG